MARADTIAGNTVVLDGSGKIIPWHSPASRAYHEFIVRRWNFIETSVPPCPGQGVITNYPQYYFFDGFGTTNPDITPDYWMNDIGEKIPNWFESARHYYAYTGDTNVMNIVRNLMDYFIAHGTSPANFAWPNFPYTTANHGEMEVDGFQTTFAQHETHVDHAGDIGLAYYGLYRFTGEAKYLTNALNVADVLAANARVGTATESVWPYRVRMDTGAITAQYGANFIGAYALLDALVKAGHGNTNAYAGARTKARTFILQFPMQTGYWTDGHTDNPVNSTTYKSNMSKSNTALFLFDHPDFDPDWQTNIPAMIAWTETNFVYRVTAPEPAEAYGAQVVGEQDGFNYKMDYQTARHAAECARWYRHSGDTNYLEKAYRSLNWVTYCSDANGRATESPYSLGIATWWSDCYGECPRMFYHAFAAMPEWAPPGEDHILYSSGVLTGVVYGVGAVQYHATEPTDREYLRVSFLPDQVTLNGSTLTQQTNAPGWQLRALGGGDYAITVLHTNAGQVRVAANNGTLPPSVSLTGPLNGATYSSPGLITLTATATGYAGPVTNVAFVAGATKLGADTVAPYSFTWPNVPIGSYTLTARATDATGLSRTSAPVNVTVIPPVGPVTLGNTSEGATTDYITDGSGAYINACRFQAGTDQTLTAIKARVYAISGKYQCAIYADNAGNAANLLRPTSEVTPATTGWHTFPLTSSLAITKSQYYWLAIWSNDSEARVYTDNGGTVRFGLYPYAAGWPNPVNLSGSGGFTYCLYATGPSPTVYNQWKSNYSIAAATPHDDDTDGDALPLLLEYACGLDPQTNSAGGGRVWPSLDGGFLSISYSRSKAATDITCAAEVAGQVTGVWSSAAEDVEQRWQVTDGITSEDVTARDKTPITNATSRFMRLKVSLP